MSTHDSLTPDEAAAILQRDRTYIVRLIERGDLEGRRLGPATRGGRWLVDAASVERLKKRWEAEPPRRGRPADADPSPIAAAQRRFRARREGETS